MEKKSYNSRWVVRVKRYKNNKLIFVINDRFREIKPFFLKLWIIQVKSNFHLSLH